MYWRSIHSTLSFIKLLNTTWQGIAYSTRRTDSAGKRSCSSGSSASSRGWREQLKSDLLIIRSNRWFWSGYADGGPSAILRSRRKWWPWFKRECRITQFSYVLPRKSTAMSFIFNACSNASSPGKSLSFASIVWAGLSLRWDIWHNLRSQTCFRKRSCKEWVC